MYHANHEGEGRNPEYPLKKNGPPLYFFEKSIFFQKKILPVIYRPWTFRSSFFTLWNRPLPLPLTFYILSLG